MLKCIEDTKDTGVVWEWMVFFRYKVLDSFVAQYDDDILVRTEQPWKRKPQYRKTHQKEIFQGYVITYKRDNIPG